MSILQRALRWLLREAMAASDATDPARTHRAYNVWLITKAGTTIDGVLVATTDTEYVFAPGARVMSNGSTRWHAPDAKALCVPISECDHYVRR